MSKTTREFAKVVIKMLSCIPEDDQLKEPLQKILEKFPYFYYFLKLIIILKVFVFFYIFFCIS